MTTKQLKKRDRKKLSERQRKILDFIEQFIEVNGYPPTIRDIGKAVNIGSTSVVNYNLNKLVRDGYLERSKKVSRGLQLVKDDGTISAEVMAVGLMGQIVASQPIEFFDYHHDDDEVIEIPLSLLGKVKAEDVFALRVKGNSMIDAMVSDGDIVILRRQQTAQDKDMVAARMRDTNETTLKHFFHEGERIRLQPAHPEMEPIYVHPSQIEIQGRVLAVFRSL